MKKSFTIVAALLFILLSINLRAKDEVNKTKLEDYFHQLYKNNKAMCGVCITKKGKLVYENYIGFSSVKDKKRNNKLTKFRIGSITKVFTAVMIFQLIEEGRLTLETKLSECYPQIPNSKKITISDLLGHRSGIHNYFATEEEYLQNRTSKKSKEEMIKFMANFKSDFKPNEKFGYSNSNYVLLGYIIEEIAHSTYQHELKKRITSKLNLSNTYYGKKIDKNANEAFSYVFLKKKWTLLDKTDMSILGGAGAIVSTPKDLDVFITALFDNKLISKKSLNQMKKMKEGYGKGLVQFSLGNKIAYGHNGGFDGFLSFLIYIPSENVAISIAANGMNYGLFTILNDVFNIYFNIPFKIPDFTAKGITLSIKELEKYKGEFLSKLSPLKVITKVKDGQLYAQATGQWPFPLTPFSRTEFRFDGAEIIIEFAKNNKGEIQYDSFTISQEGGKKSHYEK